MIKEKKYDRILTIEWWNSMWYEYKSVPYMIARGKKRDGRSWKIETCYLKKILKIPNKMK